MLGYCRPHSEYVSFVLSGLKTIARTHPEQVAEHRDSVLKMLLLDLDPMLPVIAPLYPPFGRPAMLQTEIFRSLVLMMDVGCTLDSWVAKLCFNPVLRLAAGFALENMPKTSSYYDFINRIFTMPDAPVLRGFVKKPKSKLKKGEKLPPKNKDVVSKLVARVIDDESRFARQLERRPERFLQKIFARVAVDASVSMGLVPTSVSVSGDGTCIETGASQYGKKVCSCTKLGIYKCGCARLFSDPSANWGWDSHKERYFYGHTGYFITTCNKDEKVDLPIYLRLVQASRHDSVSAVFALFELRQLNPNLHVDTFISDSASDNHATYNLLAHWDINAVIALGKSNNGNFKYPPPFEIDPNGVPICQSGRRMLFNGCCKGRSRLKWRCPRSFHRIEETTHCPGCSPSPYGRVVYTKPEWDRRLFSHIPRGSVAWKAKMKERTAVERVNDRILNDYGIEGASTRGKKRISVMVTLAGINIHLDAQMKFLKSRGLADFDRIVESGVVW